MDAGTASCLVRFSLLERQHQSHYPLRLCPRKAPDNTPAEGHADSVVISIIFLWFIPLITAGVLTVTQRVTPGTCALDLDL